MSRDQVLTDPEWALIEPLLPSSKGKASRPFRDHRQVLEGIVSGIALAVRGGTYPTGSGRGRRCGSAMPGSARTARGTGYWSG